MNDNINENVQLKLERRKARRASLFEKNLVRTAGKQAVVMLKPWVMARNPVMFVTEIGATLDHPCADCRICFTIIRRWSIRLR